MLGLEGDVWVIMGASVSPRPQEKARAPHADFWDVWREALKPGLPEGRLLHDLWRSALRTLIRARVDEMLPATLGL
jgi:hypothetical protein